AVAQQPAAPAAPADQPTRQDVLAFMDVLQVRQTMVQMLDGVREQARKGAEAGFKYKMPNATSEQLATVGSLVDDAFKDISPDELIEVMIPVYQKHLSKNDLQQIVAFYKSPAGAHLLAEQPAMMQESMTASSELMQAKMPAMLKRLDEK